jgi:hypothetical protein
MVKWIEVIYIYEYLTTTLANFEVVMGVVQVYTWINYKEKLQEEMVEDED